MAALRSVQASRKGSLWEHVRGLAAAVACAARPCGWSVVSSLDEGASDQPTPASSAVPPTTRATLISPNPAKGSSGPGPDCPVERNRLSATILRQPKIPLAGLDPAIHAFLDFGDLGGQRVDARIKSGQGVPTVAL